MSQFVLILMSILFLSGCAILSDNRTAEKLPKSDAIRTANFEIKLRKNRETKTTRKCFSDIEADAYIDAFKNAGFVYNPRSDDTIEVVVTDITEPNTLGPVNAILTLATLTFIPAYSEKEFNVVVTHKRDSKVIQTEESRFGYEKVFGILFAATALKQSYWKDLREYRGNSVAATVSKIKLENVDGRAPGSDSGQVTDFKSAFDVCEGFGDRFLHGM